MAGFLPDAARLVLSIGVGAVLTVAPFALGAQQEVEPVLSGRLLVSGQPADTGTVILHRVTPEDAGDLDSTSVAPDGSFSFTLPNLPVPGSGEVFFVSTRHDGVLYAGDPVSDPIQLDSLQTVEAYPTEAAAEEGAAFPLTRREVWIDESAVGWQVTDVLEIRNPGATTLVPPTDGGAVWRYPLPPGAMSPRMIQMGPSTGEADFEGGLLVARNPVLPAENYYVIQYDLESLEFDIPMPGRTGLMQLLLREPAPAVRVQGLARQPNEQIEVGASFLRWAGEDLSDETVAIRLGEETESRAVVWLSVALALLLVAIGAWLVQRRAPAAPGTPGLSRDGGGPPRRRIRKEILVEVARLDEAFARLEDPGQAERERYHRRRAELMVELTSTGPGETQPGES